MTKLRSGVLIGALVGLCALIGGAALLAAPPPNISTTVGICSPWSPQNCLKPAADGSLPVTSTQSGTGDVNLTQVGGAAVKTGAGTASGSIRVELPTDGTGKVGLNAGEAHVGEVGGNQSTITVAQTVTASSAYTSGNAVGGLMTLSNAARVSAGSGLIQSVINYTKSAQTGLVDVVIFNANPTATTCTDKTAFSVAAADFDKVVGVAHVNDWTSLGTPAAGQAQNLAIPYALASGTTLYACAVTRSTPTYSSTSDVSFGFRLIRN